MEKKNLDCPLEDCYLVFSSEEALHVHPVKVYYKCPLLEGCDLAFDTNEALENHMKNQHFKCPFIDCDLVFATEAALKSHVKTKYFKCPLGDCGLVYRTEDALKIHMEFKEPFHTEGDPYPCLLCDDVIFDKKEELERHFSLAHDDFVNEVRCFSSNECRLHDFCEFCHLDKNLEEDPLKHECDLTKLSDKELRLLQRAQSGFPIILRG